MSKTIETTETTRVVFRKFPDGEVIALFPEIVEGVGMISSYLLVGQHGAASTSIVYSTKPASRDEYSKIKEELENHCGYNLDVRKRLI